MFKEYTVFFLSLIDSGVAPYAGLAIGVLATTLLESSSAVVATTMVSMASMVDSGLSLSSAIRFGVPMVLGANVGTTVGNTITLFAIRRSTTKEEFNATIPGVIVDDIYEFLTISIFFVLEVTTGFLSTIVTRVGFFFFELLKLERFLVVFEDTIIDIIIEDPIIKPMGNLFVNIFGTQLSGVFFFIFWFIVVVISIDFFIGKGLRLLIKTDWGERVAAAFSSPFRSFFTGFSITWLVGSSSIGTSLAIPMIATKMVDLERAYPYLCGCNLATTVDMAQIYGYIAGGVIGIMLGSAHVLLNIFALIIWLASPLRVVPIRISRIIGSFISSKPYSEFYLIAYAIGVFIVLPIIVILFL
jgi:sodium-dependent phosphate cotransporter